LHGPESQPKTKPSRVHLLFDEAICFRPEVKNKPNLPNAFTSMTLSTTPSPPHPPPQKRDYIWLPFYLFIYFFSFSFSLLLFFAGF